MSDLNYDTSKPIERDNAVASTPYPTSQWSQTGEDRGVPALFEGHLGSDALNLNSTALRNNTSLLSPLDTAARIQPPQDLPGGRSPLSAGLRIHTDIHPGLTITTATEQTLGEFSCTPAKANIKRTPSIKNLLLSSMGSNASGANSVLSSPMLNAMPDVTPLPSPLMSNDSPGPWQKLVKREILRDLTVPPSSANSALVTTNGESISSAIANQSKRRAYHGLLAGGHEAATSTSALGTNRENLAEGQGHSRNRSLSEYVPDGIQVHKARNITVSSIHMPQEISPDSAVSDSTMRREPNLAIQRGLVNTARPPTPPSSRTGGDGNDSDSSCNFSGLMDTANQKYEYFDAFTRYDGKRRRWRGLKVLGEGTFSKVLLATSQAPEDDGHEDAADFAIQMNGILALKSYVQIDRRTLVAIKVCEHGPKGGDSEERIEVSLKRELEIMKVISHPSLVHLKAWNIEKTRAFLVLTYCPGGDLFDVLSQHKELMVSGLIRRIFSELVGAVQYLHAAHIVHRDIKLENVLVNLTPIELAEQRDWMTYPHSVVTLTDLGLSRWVAEDEKLETRCGSDDYAAPEVIMGQGYDGRATDAWSLGVLLYALVESRLPFDPHPRMTEAQRTRSRLFHRIARIDWEWVQYAGDEGDHEANPQKFKEADLEGAMIATDSLLRRTRNRWTMKQLEEFEWVKGGVAVEGGIKFREEDIPKEVSEDA
ncbi:kinase-like protein [Calycina marina]|uniref:Kinase-like protein n=1 Tax=Calycina marina TaxID=1763456 RepID=A0A9P7Z855_9HELO|nr:kinase-like protein [Calycina marina]